jgi:hypothetical protein
MPRHIGSSIDEFWNETVGGVRFVAAGETSRFTTFQSRGRLGDDKEENLITLCASFAALVLPSFFSTHCFSASLNGRRCWGIRAGLQTDISESVADRLDLIRYRLCGRVRVGYAATVGNWGSNRMFSFVRPRSPAFARHCKFSSSKAGRKSRRSRELNAI